MRRTAIWKLAIVAAAAAVVVLAWPYYIAAALILRAANAEGWPGAIARWQARVVDDRVEHAALPRDTIRVRIFRPAGRITRSALLISGVHPEGIDEPRLVKLARDLAGTGIAVVTPEIPDLIHYRITPLVTDTIEEMTRWMLQRPDEFGDRPLAMIGVSFSGGLSIVAAGRPAIRDRVGYVVSFGGHGHLPRVLRYLATGVEPSLDRSAGIRRTPHDYALAIVLHQSADLLAPRDQVEPLRGGIETFLRASALARTEPENARALFAHARRQERQLAEPAAALLKSVNDRNVVALGAELLPRLGDLGQDPSLSPERSAPPIAPVYLLHGSDDNVIPAIETKLLARHLQRSTRVRYLISGFLTHVDVASLPTAGDTWRMIAFWKAVLRER